MRIELSPVGTQPDVLAIGLPEADPYTLPKLVTQAFGPSIGHFLEAEEFIGKVGTTVAIASFNKLCRRWLLVVGTGSGSNDDLRHAAGIAGDFARSKGATALDLTLGPAQSEPEQWVRAVVEGAVAGNYRFDRYRPEADRKPPTKHLRVNDTHGQAPAAKLGRIHAAAQEIARDLVNEPAEAIYPETLAEAASKLAAENLTVEVWDEHRIQEAGMGGIWAVGRGSTRMPRFVHAHFTPKSGTPRKKIAIIGKGVTFDSGGLSIKPSSGMQTMRCDMGGAAAVIGVLSALVELDPQVEVHGIFAAAENMLGGNAYKLGDCLMMFNGKTVEVHNTDAEGRLVLADCLSYASKLDVDQIIDLATLTGAVVVALGEHYTAVYTDSDQHAADWQAAADAAGEGLWRMPLEPLYKEKLKATWGSIKNVGGRAAGSITAALFLKEFVDPKIPWCHFDIAGPAFLSSKDRYLDVGATGAMVRTMLRYLEAI
jgi:leucyl aminopeptidase